MSATLVWIALSFAWGQSNDSLDAITFAEEPGVLYLPAREVSERLGISLEWDARVKQAFFGGRGIDMDGARTLWDGTLLVHTGTLKALGIKVEGQGDGWFLSRGEMGVAVQPGQKRVVVDKGELELRAYQGDRLVLASRISIGMEGHGTPEGEFRAGPYKAELHRSSIYDNARMPWSVQVTGHVFIHGWEGRVGGRNSHGCIRLRVDGFNPARWFYEWVDVGTPVRVLG